MAVTAVILSTIVILSAAKNPFVLHTGILGSQSLRSCFLRMTLVLAALLYPGPAAAQLEGQSFQVTSETTHPTVGDSVSIRFRARLHERDLLLDTLPRLVEALPPGVRLLSVEKLTRGPDRIFRGSARLAFYRPGRRPVPVFGLTFMRNVGGIPRAILASDSSFVEVRPVLPAGDPPLKDIKETDHGPRSPVVAFLIGLFIAGLGFVYRIVRRRRRTPPPAQVEPDPPPPPRPRTPYEIALDRLDQVETAGWPSRGDVPRHYEVCVDILRDYLEEAEEVGARERTTSELLWSLPPHLTAGGLRNRCHDVLNQADLVKFAEVRPSEASAAAFLSDARLLLESWHRARPREEVMDAVR